MLRRNLLKNIVALVSVPFLTKNVKNNNTNWELLTKNEMNLVVRKDYSDGRWEEYTYNEQGQALTHKDSSGYCWEKTYDKNGYELTYKDSYGIWRKYTYGENVMLSRENSDGLYEEWIYENDRQIKYILNDYWHEFKYNKSGRLISLKDSNGKWLEFLYDEQEILCIQTIDKSLI